MHLKFKRIHFSLVAAATMHRCFLLLQKQHRKNKDVFNLVGPNLLLEEDTVPSEVTHFLPL